MPFLSTLLQYTLYVDRHARNRRKTPEFEEKIFFGQLNRILLIELPPEPWLALAEPTTLILALVQEVKTTSKDGIYSYKEFGVEEVVDLDTVQYVIGRVKDRGEWAIVDRSDNVDIQVDWSYSKYLLPSFQGKITYFYVVLSNIPLHISCLSLVSLAEAQLSLLNCDTFPTSQDIPSLQGHCGSRKSPIPRVEATPLAAFWSSQGRSRSFFRFKLAPDLHNPRLSIELAGSYKTTTDRISASSTSTPSYAASIPSSAFTLSSTTDGSTASSALFEEHGGGNNVFSIQLKKLYRALFNLETSSKRIVSLGHRWRERRGRRV